MTPLLHIFRAGTHTDAHGTRVTITPEQLAASARAYDPARHEAPIVVGHPSLDAPAYGWIKSLSADAAGLTASPHQVDAAFSELVRAGRFKKISASFYLPDNPANPAPGTYYLRHVGFLGAAAPAVKGLKAVQFAESEPGTVTFSEVYSGLMAGASLWRRLRDWMLAQFGVEVADQVIPEWHIEDLRRAADAAEEKGFSGSFSESESDPSGSPTHEEHTVTPEEAAALAAENERLKAELTAAKAEIENLKQQLDALKQQKDEAEAEQAHAENVDYAEKLIREGRLAPKNKEAVAAMLDHVSRGSVQFAEGNSKRPMADVLKEFLGAQPKVVDFGEIATNGRAGGASVNPLLADAERRAAKK